MAKITGDFRKLEAVALAIPKLGKKTKEVVAEVAPAIGTLIDKEFSAGRDPYGKPWKPLATATLAKGRTPPPLTDTGEMRTSVKVSAKGNSVEYSIEDPKAGFHQFGTRRKLERKRAKYVGGKHVATMTHGLGIPPRPILPEGKAPASWTKAIKAIASKIIGKAFK